MAEAEEEGKARFQECIVTGCPGGGGGRGTRGRRKKYARERILLGWSLQTGEKEGKGTKETEGETEGLTAVRVRRECHSQGSQKQSR